MADEGMAQHVKYFEWLMYASLVVGILACMADTYSVGDWFLLLVIFALAAGLVRLAARKGSRLAVSILGALTVLAILIVIADVSDGSITWLAYLVSDPAPPKLTLILDGISAALMAAGMAFYLFGDRRAAQP